MTLKIIASENTKKKPEGPLGFGRYFTDHMFMMNYKEGKGWHDARIVPYQPLCLDPAAMVFHYGQAIFEGLKVYRNPDGELQFFRIMDNLNRFNRSADRLCIPNIDTEFVLGCIKQLVELDKAWVPTEYGQSLYVRPFAIAADPFLGVKVAESYIFMVILSPVANYYAEGIHPVKILVENEYVRSVRGGMGFAKAAGNYACSLIADATAKKYGCSQVLWLDGVERKYIEEVGSMNILFVIDGKLVTPSLDGSILAGITRDSILKLASSMGIPVEERKISIQEVAEAHAKGTLSEVFGAGTAAVVSPVGTLIWEGKEYTIGDGGIGPVTQKLYDELTGIQYGIKPDPMGWITKL